VKLKLKTASVPYILRQGWPEWQAKSTFFEAAPTRENGSYCRSGATKECASFAGVVLGVVTELMLNNKRIETNVMHNFIEL
jgi:hypothetical protein